MGHILITSLSNKVPLIGEVRKAASRLKSVGKVYGADSNPNCIGRYFVDQFWQMPMLDQLNIMELIRYCQTNNIRFIIPTRDGELLYFAQHKRTLRDQGIQVMVSDAESVASCLDKLRFYEQAQALRYPAIITSSDIDCIHAGRYVVKERYGAGSRSIGLNLSKVEAIRHADGLQQPIFQPYIAGREFGIDAYIDRDGNAKGTVARRRSLVVNGESQITETMHHPELEAVCARLGEALKLYGHLVFQALLDDQGAIHIIECNARFGGASRLSLEAGLDSFYWFLLEAGGADLRQYPFIRATREKKLVRYAEDMIILADSRE